jgi:hypothetical protein
MYKDEIKKFINKIQIVYNKNEGIRSFVKLEELISSLNELDNLTEMYEVKSVIISHIQALIVLKLKNSSGFYDEHMLHTVFYGHPGVGKSKTARILTRIWKSLGIINCCKNITEKEKSLNINSLDLLKESNEIRKLFLKLYGNYLQPQTKDCKTMWKNNEALWDEIKKRTGEFNNLLFETPEPDTFKVQEIENKDCQVVIAGREDFVAQYTGQTAIKTIDFLKSCKGKCVIIEEAYLLYNGETDTYGMEALTVLNRYMDEHPKDIIIIFTGYEDKLKSSIFKAQPGLIRRCQLIFNLIGYTHEGLAKIFVSQLQNNNWSIESLDYVIDFFERNFFTFENFGGDTEKLSFNCKMIYSQNLINQMYQNDGNDLGSNIITNDILEKAYEIYLKNKI